MAYWLGELKKAAPQKHTINPESRYADDAKSADALVETTRAEEASRYEIIEQLRDGLAKNQWPRPKQEQAKRNELAALKAEYDSTWSELTDAIGHAAVQDIRAAIEAPTSETEGAPSGIKD